LFGQTQTHLLFVDERSVRSDDLFTIPIPQDSIDPRMGLDQTFQDHGLALPRVENGDFSDTFSFLEIMEPSIEKLSVSISL
jgi:hypothetical protein